MSFWTPVENPGTRPWRSWVFDVGCALLAAATSFGSFSFAPAAQPALPTLAVSLVVAVLTALVLSLRRVWPGPVFVVTVLMAAVLTQWPVRGALFPFPSAIALYTVAVTMSRTTAIVAAALAVAAELPAAGQGGWHNGWLPAIYEVIGIASVLVTGLYVSTRRAYLAELHDRTSASNASRPDQRAGRGGGAGPDRPRDARQRGPPPHRHHRALMDVRMPGHDGIEATRDIVAAGLPCRVLILTTFDLDDYVYAGLRPAPAASCSRTPSPPTWLPPSAPSRPGDAVLAPAATSRLVRQFAATPNPKSPQTPEPPGAHPGGTQIRQALTDREQDVFSRIAAGMSNSEIAASLFLSEGTVKIHVGRILAKLGLRDRVQAVVLAYESRLITPGTPPPDPPGRPR